MAGTLVRQDTLALKGSPLSGKLGIFDGENPQPLFRQKDFAVSYGFKFPDGKKNSFGRETGFRVLPYTMQDRYKRELIDMEFSSVVMENDFLKAEFIPSLGGRLWSLFDKRQNGDIIYRNPIFRPANLATRNAWFSGGIEWNIGRLGHSVHTCSPVFSGLVEHGGLTVFRLWEFERQTGLLWRIEFSLPDDSTSLFVYSRIENIDDMVKPLYWWVNAAIPQEAGVRVFSASDEVIYIVPGTGNVKTMDCGRLPHLPVLEGKDASYPALSNYSNEYFFQNDFCAIPWEAAVYEDGYAYGEVSTPPLTYRKMFCWGNGSGGRRWQDFLSLPGQEYLEVQAGIAPTQLHTADIAGRETVDFVQAFTAFRAEPEQAHQNDYRSASAYVEECLKQCIDSATLKAALERGRERAGMSANILSMGSGWGALEGRLRNKPIPAGLSFPRESIGKDEAPWAELLQTGALPLRSPEAGPGSFVVDDAWETLLEASPVRKGDWLTPYHLGVIAFEKGDDKKALACWQKSLEQLENPWAYRNLAQAAMRAGDTEKALDHYRNAMAFSKHLDMSFAEEYIPLLFATGNEGEAKTELEVCISQAGSLEALPLPLLETAARLALNGKDDTMLDKIFSIEQAHLREGNTTMVEIWIEREIRRLNGKGIPRAEAEKWVMEGLVDGALVPPREIDFRMYTG